MKNDQTGKKEPITIKKGFEKKYDKYEVLSDDDRKYYSSKEVRIEKIIHKN